MIDGSFGKGFLGINIAGCPSGRQILGGESNSIQKPVVLQSALCQAAHVPQEETMAVNLFRIMRSRELISFLFPCGNGSWVFAAAFLARLRRCGRRSAERHQPGTVF